MVTTIEVLCFPPLPPWEQANQLGLPTYTHTHTHVYVYGCVRARVWCMIACLLYPELNQSVLNQNPAKGSTSWPRHLEKIWHGQNLPRSWAPGQDLVLPARSWPYGQDLEHLAQDTWTRTFCWVKVGHFCLLEVSHFVSATWR